MSKSERGIFGKIHDGLQTLKRGYSQSQLETQERYAFGEITTDDIESYRTQQKEMLRRALVSSSPRGIAMTGSFRMADHAVRRISELPAERIAEQMRIEARMKLSKWGKTP